MNTYRRRIALSFALLTLGLAATLMVAAQHSQQTEDKGPPHSFYIEDANHRFVGFVDVALLCCNLGAGGGPVLSHDSSNSLVTFNISCPGPGQTNCSLNAFEATYFESTDCSGPALVYSQYNLALKTAYAPGNIWVKQSGPGTPIIFNSLYLGPPSDAGSCQPQTGGPIILSPTVTMTPPSFVSPLRIVFH